MAHLPRLTDPTTLVLKNKKLDEKLTVMVTQNDRSGRIFVEFISDDGKLVLQRSFQNTVCGLQEAEQFQKSFKSIKDLKKYFGLKQ